MINDENIIKHQVLKELVWDERVDASEITLEVNGSEVAMKGKVHDKNAHQAAEDAAWAVPGVYHVENTLECKSTLASHRDIYLASRIYRVLLWDKVIDSSEILVSVSGNCVSLEGRLQET